jgi:hypothetical protein
MKIGKLLLAIGGAALLSACTTKPTTGITQFDYVKFKVQGDSQPKVVFTSRENRKCANKPQKRGCIFVDQYNTANVEMKLRGSGGWRFDRLEICQGGDKREPGDDCVLPPDDARQFAIFVDNKPLGRPDDEGIFQFSVSSELRKFNLLDYNHIAGQYFYRIRLCEVETDTCIWSDPPIINRGMGSGFF